MGDAARSKTHHANEATLLTPTPSDRNASRHFHSEAIHRTPHGRSAPLQDMGIDLRGFHVLMSKQLLHGSDVIADINQMCRKAVPQRMHALHACESRPAEPPP